MPTKIFVNLAVKDLNRSVEFFTKLGYQFNAQFTNADATCMIIADDIYAMLLVEPFFQTFTKKAICDTKTTVEALLALTVDSRQAVDEFVNKALAAGATEPKSAQDQGFMYSRIFEDLDGHTWEIFWMDPSAVQQ
ncbi:glyoxalase/bleomycin resistance/extradiol dioxygenase family protein [Candidatus Gracilibacteria bacterium]|nr:glyoxalase/bleomycin resistance/extradiol dioxygenase family protein [Candidatus Gracilibacteria bacterium]